MKKETEFSIEELFGDDRTLPNKDAGTRLQVIRAGRSMPDLSPFRYIYNIVVVAPKIFKPVLEPAVINGEQGFSAGETLAPRLVVRYIMVKIVHVVIGL